MKKLFVNPEINSTALTPGESIMSYGILSLSSTEPTAVSYTVRDGATATDLNNQYNMWKGFKTTE